MLTRTQVLEAFRRLSEHLREAGVIGEINLLGGTAMMLAFNAREATRDVDAIFAPTQVVRVASQRVAEELDLPPDWLNDAAKGYASASGEYSAAGLPQYEHLRVLAPVPEYLLAMKVLAARAGIGAERGDRDDIEFLIRMSGLRTTDEVMAVVERYYAAARVPARSMYVVEDILASMEPRRDA